ncbi:MAG: class I SAM-dependent methyltransferase [Deltaproteobacteria bacterium]|jgi:cyclopropane-fatty-acyl-phospholipid synthase|nr:class I SAM-dependent methyltransferase [Deltaproteobacteria bacterium]
MMDSIMPAEAPELENIQTRPTDGLARRFLFRILRKLKHGQITIQEGPHRYTFGQSQTAHSLKAVITVHHPRFYSKAVLGGSIGTAEAYMIGLWSADNLTTALRIMALNRESFERLDKGWSKVSVPFHRFWHFLRKNTRSGSRKNIVAHYDLGNDFYQLFLDETLTYSCGIFESENSSMRDASFAKYDRIGRKLELGPDDDVIEIGSGWGGFAIYAVQNFGCRVTTTTISDQQFELAQQRIADSGVADRIELVKKDYRDLKGKYSKLVSIEMIEAVGHHYLDAYFKSCSRLLKPDGMMLLQAITIADQVYERHRHSVDFIKRYIFPGSCIPAIAAMTSSIARVTDLRLFHLEDITPHYARTLACWRKQFFNNIDDVKGLNYSEAFIRMWEFYLSYCEAGFAERYIGDVQMLLTKPMCRRDSLIPAITVN